MSRHPAYDLHPIQQLKYDDDRPDDLLEHPSRIVEGLPESIDDHLNPWRTPIRNFDPFLDDDPRCETRQVDASADRHRYVATYRTGERRIFFFIKEVREYAEDSQFRAGVLDVCETARRSPVDRVEAVSFEGWSHYRGEGGHRTPHQQCRILTDVFRHSGPVVRWSDWRERGVDILARRHAGRFVLEVPIGRGESIVLHRANSSSSTREEGQFIALARVPSDMLIIDQSEARWMVKKTPGEPIFHFRGDSRAFLEDCSITKDAFLHYLI